MPGTWKGYKTVVLIYLGMKLNYKRYFLFQGLNVPTKEELQQALALVDLESVVHVSPLMRIFSNFILFMLRL